MITLGRPIVVGIDGGPSDYDQALQYAADAAHRWGVGVRLVHGCEPHSRLPRMDEAVPVEQQRRIGRQQTRIAARRLRDLVPPGREISISVSPDTGLEALVDESADAPLLVVQRREISGLKRFASGSVTSDIAARAHCPVVVVRSGARGGKGDVVVGVDDAGHAQAALSAAFGEAERWGCGVVAVHAWQWEDSVTEFGFYPTDPHDVFAVEEARRIRLAEAIEPYATAHPGVHVGQVVIPGTVPRALLDAAIDARLLVVSRHKPAPAPRALGSIARRCISEAVCPVMVVAGSRPVEQRVEDPVRAAVE